MAHGLRASLVRCHHISRLICLHANGTIEHEPRRNLLAQPHSLASHVFHQSCDRLRSCHYAYTCHVGSPAGQEAEDCTGGFVRRWILVSACVPLYEIGPHT